MIGDETVNGKKIFDVGFLDFCRLSSRTERRTKFSLDNKNLMEHIVKHRYARNFAVRFNGIIVEADSLGKKKSNDSGDDCN